MCFSLVGIFKTVKMWRKDTGLIFYIVHDKDDIWACALPLLVLSL